MRAAARVAALLAGLAAAPAQAGEALEARALAELERRGLGADALLIIDNVIRHEAPPPRAAPALVRELLARPLEAADAAALFRRAAPPALVAFADGEAKGGSIGLSSYLRELRKAQRVLRAAAGEAEVRSPDEALPSPDELISLADALDAAGIERATALFVEATRRFIRGLGQSDFRRPRSFESAIGPVLVGTSGDDKYAAGPALIIDPGGDDFYERSPARGGAVAVIVDLGGDDRYVGSDAALGALSAIVDLAGDDRYESPGPGLGAAIAGAALLVDLAGNDSYEAKLFGQGAAAFGLGALLDFGGDDTYRLRAWGQGFGLTAGTGLLWDRAGDDHYAAGGIADAYERGGGVSGAQGAAFGIRTALGGGVGILRDEQGADRYEAEMFAQGSGYYYGAGLLWDGGGDDRYHAVRYAQGNGAHEAVGTLRDESGADRYELVYGAGQGMGLDLAVGALIERAGDDLYRAGFFAQGTATANGLGLLDDAGGTDQMHIAHRGAWGAAEPMRGLPSVALFLHHARPARTASLPPAPESDSCGKETEQSLEERIARLRPERFAELVAVGEALRCALQAGAGWAEAERLLAAHPSTPLAGWIAGALAHAPASRRESLVRTLEAHPRCAVRALALESVPRPEAARAALGSSCWRLQAAALAVLERVGEAPGALVSLPRFLRGRRAY